MLNSQAQILVKTPLTTNGTDPVLDGEGKLVYSESILMAPARKALEKRNEALPAHLKMIIEDYTPETPTNPVKQPKPEAAVKDKEKATA